MDNANVYEIIAIAYFIGYLLFDCYVATCLLDNLYTSNGIQNIVHHSICLFMCIGCLYSQKYVLTTGHVTMFTELSTVFLMVRWFLYMHKAMESRLYFVNGMVFTMSFFVVRNCL